MKKTFLVLVFSFLVLPFISFAADFQGVPTYSLSKGAVIEENIYVASNSINILGTVNGDVSVAGGTVMVLGDMLNDLNVAGGTLILEGDIGDDARLIGGTLAIGGKIGGELLAAGGQITLTPSLEINGDIELAGGDILIDGDVGGNLVVYGETVRIDGEINGDVSVKVSQKLTIGNKAEIFGNLNYSAPEELTIEDGAKITGEIVFKEIVISKNKAISKKGFIGLFGIGWLLGLLTSLVGALVAYFVLGKKIKEAVNYTLDNFGKETLRGFVILVVLPIAIIISLITVVGILLGFAGIMLYILMAIFASIFAPIILGTIIFRKLLKKPDFGVDWKSITIGVLAMKIIGIIPFIGWIFCFVFFLTSFGMLFNYLYKHFKKA